MLKWLIFSIQRFKCQTTKSMGMLLWDFHHILLTKRRSPIDLLCGTKKNIAEHNPCEGRIKEQSQQYFMFVLYVFIDVHVRQNT